MLFINYDQFQETVFYSGLVCIVLQTQQSIKHSLMFTYMVFQFSYFAIYVSAQQSAQVKAVSGTLGVGYKRLPPTTSQQDQSAKKKPKKSNNENEGDVSTILQESDESGRIKILNISMMYLYTEFPNFDTNSIL
jgi:hypothetical protein